MEVKLGETLYFDFPAHRNDTGAIANADRTPSAWVYEDESASKITSGLTVAQRGSETGEYYVKIIASAGNGYAVGKCYNVWGTGIVNSIPGKIVLGTFILRSNSLSDILTDKTGYSLLQAFPPNFANLAITETTGKITVNGAVNINSNADITLIKTKTDNLPADTNNVLVLVKALAGKNFKLVNTTYDANHNMLEGTVKYYATQSDLEADINVIDTHIITGVYAGPSEATSLVKKG
ncbi:hypothetical protein HY745_08375 [Candidatus Desantisbacteria bacterium]|nr:hypothetical protein [Candidatus Desantisbacteria bacterium]